MYAQLHCGDRDFLRFVSGWNTRGMELVRPCSLSSQLLTTERLKREKEAELAWTGGHYYTIITVETKSSHR